jgi:hypothetical protein
MPRLKMSSWQAPPFNAPASERMGWIEESIEEGEGWLQGQKAYKEINKNFRIFDAIFNDKTKSTLITNELKYDIRKFVETLSDTREIGTLGSDAPQYKPFVEMENRLLKSVYVEGEFSYKSRQVLQYASVCGRGYMWPKCKTMDYGFGEKRIIFDPLGLMDVIPVQVPKTHDVQEAYANTIFEYMPIAEAHARFPEFQSKLQPVSRMKMKNVMASRRIDHVEWRNYGEEQRNFGDLYVEIRWTFIRDITINTTEKFNKGGQGIVLPFGVPGTSWYYEVPYVGMPIFGGYQNGQPIQRAARNEDCLLYPQLRLMISNPGMAEPMYDGPNYEWDGEMPAIQYEVDDYPWQAIGNSLVGDVGSIMQTIRKMERKVDQVATTSLNPPMGYDRTAVGGPKIENFDLFEEDVRAGMDGKPADVFHSLLPESVRVEEVHFKWLEYLSAKMGKQLGLEDVANLANLKLNVSQDTADKILEGIGPVAKGMAANVERGNGRVARRLKTMIPQHYNVARVVSIVGPDNITREVFDFDPTSMIPSHMADEFVNGLPPAKPSNYTKLQRSKQFAKNVRVTSVPSTLVKVTQMQEQLKYLQLKGRDAPISWCTVMQKLDVDNYGEIKGTTEREKYQNEQEEDLLFKAKLAAEMQKLGLGPPQGGGNEKGGGAGKKGRPPSGHAAPKIKKRKDGSSTVTESK